MTRRGVVDLDPIGRRNQHPAAYRKELASRERFDRRVAELAGRARELVRQADPADEAARQLAREALDSPVILEAVRWRALGLLDADPADRELLTALGLVSLAVTTAIEAGAPRGRYPMRDAEAQRDLRRGGRGRGRRRSGAIRFRLVRWAA